MIRSILPLGLVGAAVVGILWFANALATVNINLVRVEGTLTDAETRQVRDAVSAELQRPGVRSAAAVAAAVGSLGWVRQVRVRRHWPDVLHVAVARETLAARWGEDAWLTTGGSVVPAPMDPDRLAGLPTFHASLADGRQTMQVFTLLSEQGRRVGLHIARLDESPAGEWTATFTNGMRAVLGATALSERFERLALIYRAELRPCQWRSRAGGPALRHRRGGPLAYRTGCRRRRAARQPTRRARGDCPANRGRIDMATDQTSRIVGLDIGTSKVAAIVGEVSGANELEVIGIGTHPSFGLKKGVVVNIESTVQSIQRAVEEAELMAGCEIDSVYAGIAGSHVRGLNSHGIVAIGDREVCAEDIARVIDAAEAVAIPADQQVLHTLPQEYLIDNQEGVKEPLGMSGVRLEAKVHLVTCAVNAAQNIRKCIERCELTVNDIILEQLASSYSSLSDDERNLGVCVVDIGGGTTDIAVFSEGAIRHTAVIPIAGDQVTNDIAMALRTPTRHAEEIKVKHACALTQLAKPDQVIQVPSTGDKPPRELTRQTLAEVVEPRYEELFTLVQAELRRSGYEDLIASGLVLTGGAAKIEGVIELAEEIFHVPVSVASPRGVAGLTDIVRNPSHATGVGLLMYGRELAASGRGPYAKARGRGIFARLRNWLGDSL